MDRPAKKLAEDLLEGAEGITNYLYGDPDKRRKIHHLAETSRFPIFRLGSVLCARKSTINEWIEEQERRGRPGNNGG
jgi:predicted kinase